MQTHSVPEDGLPRTGTLWSRLTLLLLGVLMLGALLIIKDKSYFGDEGYHYSQITLFRNHEWKMEGALTTIPGYHAVLAVIDTFVGESSLAFLRFLTVIVGIIGAFACMQTLRKTAPHAFIARTYQVMMLPILFTFLPLLYTDSPSLTLILLGTWAFTNKNYGWSLLMVALSILVRQNNIIWFLCFFAAWLLTEHKDTVWMMWAQLCKWKLWDAIRTGCRTLFRAPDRSLTMFFIFCIMAFGAFIKENGGIAIGDQGSHPFPSIHLGNVYFLLSLYTVMFLPMIIGQVPAIVRRMRTSPWVIPLIVGLFVWYMLTFWSTHYYNAADYSFFLRNRILVMATATPLTKACFFGLIAVAVLSLIETKLQKPWNFLLYPMTVLFLIPSWLIEQRYYFIPLALFLIFRKPQPKGIEWRLAIYETVCALVLFWAVATYVTFV